MNAPQTLNSKRVDFVLLESNGDSKRPASAMSSISERNERKGRSGSSGSDKDEGRLLMGQHPDTERADPPSLHKTSPTPFNPQFEVKEHRSADAPKLFECYDSPQQRDAEIEAKSTTENQSCETDKKFDEIASPPDGSVASATESSAKCPSARPAHHPADCPKRICSNCHLRGHIDAVCPKSSRQSRSVS